MVTLTYWGYYQILNIGVSLFQQSTLFLKPSIKFHYFETPHFYVNAAKIEKLIKFFLFMINDAMEYSLH